MSNTPYKLPLKIDPDSYYADKFGNGRCRLQDVDGSLIAESIKTDHAQSLVLAANMFDEAVELLEGIVDVMDYCKCRGGEDLCTRCHIVSFLNRIKEAQVPEQDEWVAAMQKNSKDKEAQDGK